MHGNRQKTTLRNFAAAFGVRRLKRAMIKIGITIIVLVVLGFVVYSSMNRTEETDPVKGSLNDVERFISGLMSAEGENGVLIITLSGTTKFVQFNGSRKGVQMDFPLVTDEQKTRRDSILAAAKSLGLVHVLNKGSDGAEFIDFNLTDTAPAISKTIRDMLSQLYEANEATEFEFQAYGY